MSEWFEAFTQFGIATGILVGSLIGLQKLDTILEQNVKNQKSLRKKILQFSKEFQKGTFTFKNNNPDVSYDILKTVRGIHITFYIFDEEENKRVSLYCDENYILEFSYDVKNKSISNIRDELKVINQEFEHEFYRMVQDMMDWIYFEPFESHSFSVEEFIKECEEDIASLLIQCNEHGENIEQNISYLSIEKQHEYEKIKNERLHELLFSYTSLSKEKQQTLRPSLLDSLALLEEELNEWVCDIQRQNEQDFIKQVKLIENKHKK